MFERNNTPEKVESVEDLAMKDIGEGLTELRQIVGNNESEAVIDGAQEALFQRLAKAIEDIKKEGMIKGNTWPRPGDNSGEMDMDRFKPLG